MKLRILMALLVLTAHACTPTTAETPTYELEEFAVEGPGNLDSGESTVTVTNAGEFPHTLVIADTDGSVLFATDVIESGQTVTIDIDLGPGSYQFSCRIVGQKPDGTIVDHFEEGMVRKVDVRS